MEALSPFVEMGLFSAQEDELGVARGSYAPMRKRTKYGPVAAE